MTEEDVLIQLEVVRRRRWEREVFVPYYGVDMWAEGPARAQFVLWAGRLRDGQEALGPGDIDRWAFERFLVQREWIPLNIAALQLALVPEDLTLLLQEMVNETLVPEQVAHGDVVGMFTSRFIRDLPRQLPSFPRRIFSSQSSFVRAFHEAIHASFPELQLELQLSRVSEVLGETPPQVAYECDILTGDPLGITHQVWLDFGKPLALKPDACSMLTLARFEAVVRPMVMGHVDEDSLAVMRESLDAQDEDLV